MIGQHRPRHADDPVLLKDLLDQESAPNRIAIPRVASVELVIETAEKPRSEALVAGLGEQGPAPFVGCQQFGSAPFERGFQLVEDGIWAHARSMARPTGSAVDYFSIFRCIYESQLMAWISV